MSRRTRAGRRAAGLKHRRRRSRVSVLLTMRPVRYFKRRGKVLARCAFCGRVIRGGLRGVAKHADTCGPWGESARLLAETPGEVQSELARCASKLAKRTQ